jgi:putative sterol carrier protein
MNIKEKDSKILRQTLDYYTLAHVITKRRNNSATSQTGKIKVSKMSTKGHKLRIYIQKEGAQLQRKECNNTIP